MIKAIDGAVLARMIIHGAASINAQKQTINELNVFPVPDGDTGTNMSMTIAAAVAELRKNTPATVEQAASITASALLRGARGNSGVILSLLFRGLSKGMKGMETADAIVGTKRDMRDKPVVDQRMKSIRVETFGQVYPFDQM